MERESEDLLTSKEGDDEKRLYQCARKYEKIVKQFDDLIDMMNTKTRTSKRGRVSSAAKESNNATAPASSRQPDEKEVFVQTVTKFLHELRANPATDADSSASTRGPE